MNLLSVGTNKLPILQYLREHLHEPKLIVDDGHLIDALDLPVPRTKRELSLAPKVWHLDLSRDHLNPLQDITEFRAESLLDLFSVFFEGADSTLTKTLALDYIFENLLKADGKTLQNFLPALDRKPEPSHTYAHSKINNLLLRKRLKRFLCKSTNIPLDGVILIVRLDPAVLGDRVCKFIGNVLASVFDGQVIFTDFGYYAIPSHVSLIRQNRLIAGVNFLDELPKKLQQQVLLIENKVIDHCTTEDAEILAPYMGEGKTLTGYAKFIAKSVGG